MEEFEPKSLTPFTGTLNEALALDRKMKARENYTIRQLLERPRSFPATTRSRLLADHIQEALSISNDSLYHSSPRGEETSSKTLFGSYDIQCRPRGPPPSQ